MAKMACELLMNARQSIVAIDCLINIDKQRLECGWIAFRTGDFPPTVYLSGKGAEAEIDLPLSRRHFLIDIMQHNPDEPICFRLSSNFLKQFKEKEL